MEPRLVLDALGLGSATARPLGAGLASTAWLVEHDGARSVLRLADASQDYRREHAVLTALRGAPVPAPITGDWDVPGWTGGPFSLTSYLDGTPLDPARAPDIADDLVSFLRILHSTTPPAGLPTAEERFGPGASIDGPQVLVHSDLHEDNILITSTGAAFLDFGCAFVGSPLWEYAALAFFLGWPVVDRILPAAAHDPVRVVAARFARYRAAFPDDRDHAAAFLAALDPS